MNLMVKLEAFNDIISRRAIIMYIDVPLQHST